MVALTSEEGYDERPSGSQRNKKELFGGEAEYFGCVLIMDLSRRVGSEAREVRGGLAGWMHGVECRISPGAH